MPRRRRSRPPVAVPPTVPSYVAREQKEHRLITFDSWQEFIDQAKKYPDMGNAIPQSRATDNRKFTGEQNFDEAMSIAEKGWPEGLQLITQRLNLLSAHLPAKKFRKQLIYSVVGPGTLDMARYIMGHPECYVSWKDLEAEERASTGNIVPIVFNGTVSKGVNTETLFHKGAIICALVDLLERSNRQVELYLQHSVSLVPRDRRSKRFTMMVKIKKPEDRLSLDRIVFALAHPASLRRLFFSIIEQQDTNFAEDFTSYSYGFPYDDEDVLPKDTLYFGSLLLGYNFENEEQVKRFLKEELRKQGIALEV